jgi:GDPmannose 4,6-dehydratase
MNILSIDEARKIAQHKAVIIITGTTGQDGSFMADYLLKNTEYEVFGGARRLSVTNHENIEHLRNEKRFHLINFDLTDAHSISQVISQLKPLYFINFAAQSFVKSSWDFPSQTWDANTKSIIHILEAIRLHTPYCRFYNAGSSEEFGNVEYSPQNEFHPARPRSPYGASKCGARNIVKVYRDSYKMYAVQGWLFNHEGTRRGEEFVTRKITKAVARISKAMSQGTEFEPLKLGNVDVCRDWSDAEDCVDAVWRMLNQEYYLQLTAVKKGWTTPLNIKGRIPKEYVVSSGEEHSVREFVLMAFAVAGIYGKWIDNITDPLQTRFETPTKVLVKIDPSFYRPAEVDKLLGDSSSIRDFLGWSPKTTFDGLVEKMVKADLDRLE